MESIGETLTFSLKSTRKLRGQLLFGTTLRFGIGEIKDSSECWRNGPCRIPFFLKVGYVGVEGAEAGFKLTYEKGTFGRLLLSSVSSRSSCSRGLKWSPSKLSSVCVPTLNEGEVCVATLT